MADIRLKKSREIKRVFENGQRLRGKIFDVVFATSISEGCHLAIIVSKKSIKKAVDRNRIKRQIKEASRSLLQNTNRRGNIVIIARSAIVNKRVDEIKQELIHAFNKFEHNF